MRGTDRDGVEVLYTAVGGVGLDGGSLLLTAGVGDVHRPDVPVVQHLHLCGRRVALKPGDQETLKHAPVSAFYRQALREDH